VQHGGSAGSGPSMQDPQRASPQRP
jgi:hypothetical protein